MRATARLGAGACALREAGGEPGAGSRSPRRSPNRGEYSPRRPQRRARGLTQGPLPSPRTPGLRALRESAHLRRACTRTPGTAHAGRPSPAQPLHVLRIASRPARPPRVCTHAAPPAIYTPPGRPRCTHAPHIHSQHPDCPHCLGPASHPLPALGSAPHSPVPVYPGGPRSTGAGSSGNAPILRGMSVPYGHEAPGNPGKDPQPRSGLGGGAFHSELPMLLLCGRGSVWVWGPRAVVLG